MPPQLLNRPNTNPATEDRAWARPSDRTTADTAAQLLNQRVRFAGRRTAVHPLPAQQPAPESVQHRLLTAALRVWGQIARRPSLLVAALVGVLLLVVLLLPTLVVGSRAGRGAATATRTETTGRTTAQPLPGPGFKVYEGGASEPIRFVADRATNVMAAVPGGLLYDWREDRGAALTRMTFGDRTVEPEVDRMSPSGDRIESIRYREVWPGVDLVVRSTALGISYEFVLEPGVDPSTVVLAYPDGDALTIGADGRMHGESAAGSWTSGWLESWQDGPNGREPVSTSFVLLGGGRFGYQVGPYDVTRPLIIDPPVE